MDARPRIRLMVGAVLVLLAAWLLLRSYTSPAARECRDLYSSASTAADTAAVDTTFITVAGRSPSSSCGFMRTTARWQ